MGQSLTPELVRPLMQAGCVFVRHGKGDHDISHSPRSGTSFPVDHKILSRHTANGVLKQAGLPKHFQTRAVKAGALITGYPRAFDDQATKAGNKASKPTLGTRVVGAAFKIARRVVGAHPGRHRR